MCREPNPPRTINNDVGASLAHARPSDVVVNQRRAGVRAIVHACSHAHHRDASIHRDVYARYARVRFMQAPSSHTRMGVGVVFVAYTHTHMLQTYSLTLHAAACGRIMLAHALQELIRLNVMNSERVDTKRVEGGIHTTHTREQCVPVINLFCRCCARVVAGVVWHSFYARRCRAKKCTFNCPAIAAAFRLCVIITYVMVMHTRVGDVFGHIRFRLDAANGNSVISVSLSGNSSFILAGHLDLRFMNRTTNI